MSVNLHCSHCGHWSKSHAQRLTHVAAAHPSCLDEEGVGRLGTMVTYQSSAHLFHCSVCFFTCKDFTKLYKHIISKHCLDDRGGAGGRGAGGRGEEEEEKGGEEGEEEEEEKKKKKMKMGDVGEEEKMGEEGEKKEKKEKKGDGGEEEKKGDRGEEEKGGEEGEEEEEEKKMGEEGEEEKMGEEGEEEEEEKKKMMKMGEEGEKKGDRGEEEKMGFGGEKKEKKEKKGNGGEEKKGDRGEEEEEKMGEEGEEEKKGDRGEEEEEKKGDRGEEEEKMGEEGEKKEKKGDGGEEEKKGDRGEEEEEKMGEEGEEEKKGDGGEEEGKMGEECEEEKKGDRGEEKMGEECEEEFLKRKMSSEEEAKDEDGAPREAESERPDGEGNVLTYDGSIYRCLICGCKNKLKVVSVNHVMKKHDIPKAYASQAIRRDVVTLRQTLSSTPEEDEALGMSGELLKEEMKATAKLVTFTSNRFVCLICGWKTKLKGFAISHVARSHDVERPYGCTDCSSSFFLPSRLQQHVRTAHRPGRYACPFCCFRSHYLGGFRRHCSRCNARGEGGAARGGGHPEGEEGEEGEEERKNTRAGRKRRMTRKVMEGQEENK